MIRRPAYLSPSALATWETDRREYHIRYLGPKPSVVPQTAPMAIGSAFDAYVKDALLGLFATRCVGCKTLDTLLATSVDAPLLPVARRDGALVLADYQRLGALKRLEKYISTASTLELDGDETTVVDGIPLRGKLDCMWSGKDSATILDWKVNGYYSKASPKPGYVWSSKTGLPHEGGSALCAEWRTQLDTYRLVKRRPDCAIMIHQLTFGSKAGCVVTEYRSEEPVDPNLMDRYRGCWEAINMGRCFTDLSLKDDLEMQASLDSVDRSFMDLVR